MTHHGRTTRNVVVALAVTLMLAASALAEDTETVLHTFTGGSDGAIGGIQLVSDSAGNIYGTTFDGGNKSTSCEPYTGVPGCGVVFKLTRGAHGDWKETVLHTFTGGKDGALPSGGVILDSAGNLYGTTLFGGNEKRANCRLENVPGCGVAYKLAPTAHGPWKETVLHTFTGGKDGREPWAGLTFDQAGNLYGTATRGGDTHCKGRTPYGCGVAFKLTPTAEGRWTESVIHTFETTGRGGYLPYGGLTFDSGGNLYGTTYLGGDNSVNCFGDSGCGVVYELTPRAHGPWKETVLHAFTGGTDGGIPLFYVTLDSSGNVYGTTIYGGDTTANNCLGGNGVPAGCGAVFELTQGTWGETVLYAFTGGGDGAFDLSPLVFDSSGNLYGNTANGGDLGGACNGGCGVVFQLTPAGPPWTESVLYAFTGSADGSGPESNLLLDSAGNIFGVTEGGGNISECSGVGCGVVFKIDRRHLN